MELRSAGEKPWLESIWDMMTSQYDSYLLYFLLNQVGNQQSMQNYSFEDASEYFYLKDSKKYSKFTILSVFRQRRRLKSLQTLGRLQHQIKLTNSSFFVNQETQLILPSLLITKPPYNLHISIFPLITASLLGGTLLIFSIQKMQSRSRKLPKGQGDHEAVLHQLSNDFEVFEFLKENKLESNNIDEYARLFNCLITEQEQKKRAYGKVRLQHQLLLEKRAETSQLQIEDRRTLLCGLQQRTYKEMQISSQLQKEITQTKKSLNLLKGDIGHLVSRNQSAKLLSSKIAKVKIVAEDQLKRVTLAYVKDKEEIKLRNEMQKKFSKKLKNVNSCEKNSLTRLKTSFAETMLKKDEIFEKLMDSEKIRENFEEAEIIKKVNAQKDQQNMKLVDFVMRLAQTVSAFSIEKPEQQLHDARQIQDAIPTFFESIPSIQLQSQQQFLGSIQHAIYQIIKEYSFIEDSIKNYSTFYQDSIITRKNHQDKLQSLQKQQNQLVYKFNLEQEQNYRISQEDKIQYDMKYRKFGQNLNTLFVFLSFLEKNISFHNTYPIQQKLFSQNKQSLKKSERRSLCQQKNIAKYTYISCLHRVQNLLKQANTSQNILQQYNNEQEDIDIFYESMLIDTKRWLLDLANKYSEGYIKDLVKKRSRLSEDSFLQAQGKRQAHLKKQSSVNAEEQEGESSEEQLQYHTAKERNKDNVSKGHSQHVQQSKEKKAKRIQLLENIDSDYYKMIKSTIKMEKENTRKNYQFLRTFKRAKYASRDNILEEKRFQSSFSVLFTKQCTPALTKASKLQHSIIGTNSRSFYQATNSRSPFRYSTRKLNPTSSNSPTLTRNHSFLGKSTMQPLALRKTKLTSKLRQLINCF